MNMNGQQFGQRNKLISHVDRLQVTDTRDYNKSESLVEDTECP
jgi:hypothetical protein